MSYYDEGFDVWMFLFGSLIVAGGLSWLAVLVGVA